MGPWPPTIGRFYSGVFRALSRIQGHQWIECVGAHLVNLRVMKSGAGKAVKEVRQDEAACVD